MRLRLGWLVRCRSTIFIKFHPLRRSFTNFYSVLSFSPFKRRGGCAMPKRANQQNPSPDPWPSPWLLLAALGRVRKYQRQSQEKSPDSPLIASRSCQSQEKSPDPLLNRFRKTSFADSENTPTMQSQKNFLRRVRKTFFTDSGKPPSPS